MIHLKAVTNSQKAYSIIMTSSSEGFLSTFFSGFLITLKLIGRFAGSPTEALMLLLEDALGVLYDGSTLAEGFTTFSCL